MLVYDIKKVSFFCMDMDVRKIFELYKRDRLNMFRFKRIEEAINQDDGAKIYDNDFITIEYHNKIGYEKAKMLVDIFNENRAFYQYFLKKYSKIVIKENYQGSDKEIVINNYPTDVSVYELLQKIYPYENEIGNLLRKIDNKENLLDEDRALSFIKGKILRDKVNRKEIDFFKYLELMKGVFANPDTIYNDAVIDISFENSNMEILDNYMRGVNVSEIENYIYWELVKKYNITLFQQSLNHQEDLLLRKNDLFLANNMMALFNLFSDKYQDLVDRGKNVSNNVTDKEDISLSKDQIISLVLEFLHEMDKSDSLVNKFMQNIENGRIKIWDPKDTDCAKKLQEEYFGKFNIYNPLCYNEFDYDKLVDLVMNVPLNFMIDDVSTIVHEFIHFHNMSVNSNCGKNSALGEFLSIYYEMCVVDFLSNKGYNEEKLTNLFNFRVDDTIRNFKLSAPIIYWLNHYRNNGEIRFDYVKGLIKNDSIIQREYLKNMGLNDDEIKIKMSELGYYEDLDLSVHNLLFNLNSLMLTQDESVFGRYPYILGTILSYEGLDRGIDSNYFLDLSYKVKEIDDPYFVLEAMGLDMEKYGFVKISDGRELDGEKTSYLRH